MCMFGERPGTNDKKRFFEKESFLLTNSPWVLSEFDNEKWRCKIYVTDAAGWL